MLSPPPSRLIARFAWSVTITRHGNRQWLQISVVHLKFRTNHYKSMVGGLSRRGASPSERVCRAISDIVATHT
jgi:hypothetical protein